LEGNFLIKSNRILTPEGFLKGGIVVSGRKIRRILTSDDEISRFSGKTIAAEENIVLPGLIDIHIHGCGGWTTEGKDIGDILGLVKYLPSQGITAFQPTIGTGTKEGLKNSLRDISGIIKRGCPGARILGVHMEGPFLNKNRKGAYEESRLLMPSVDLMREFIEASDNNIIHVTLAPELEGAKELIAYLYNRNILVAGGHTDAAFHETIEAIDQGVRLSNHTCNAQRAIHHREPGAIAAYLLDDRADCEVICDFFHVHPAMIKLIVKNKSVNRICMISDSGFSSCIEPGKYNFSNMIVNIDKEGWCRLPDGTIAGSTKNLMFGFKNMVKILGYSMENVSRMASYNPARVSGFERTKGTVEVGKDADLLIVDDDFNVRYTFVEGRTMFDFERTDIMGNPAITNYKIGGIPCIQEI